MKQKAVIKVTMNGQKSRSKAFKIAVSISGVDSAAIGGVDKNQIEVTGDGFDAVVLTSLLRKKVGQADLVSVAPVEAKKEEKAPEPKAQPQPVWPSYTMPHQIFEIRDTCQYPYPNNNCSIM